jgi:CxxC motif-containing protein (DUF1111 family)
MCQQLTGVRWVERHFFRNSVVKNKTVSLLSSERTKHMKHLVAFALCIIFPMTLFAGDNGYKVTYDGGSLPDTKSGTGVKLYIESNQVRFAKDKADLVTIPASSITEISYGQDVHRRVGTAVAVGVFTLGLGALTALSKSKKHFVGLTWADGDKKGGLAMQCDKNDYRGILAGLEGVTGKKAVDSDAMTVKN